MKYRDESAYKSAMVKEVKGGGGYARRLEDQFAVGLPDMVVVDRSVGTVFVEAKLVRSGTIVATPRQKLEADRINAAGGRALLVGYDRVTGSQFVGEVTDSSVRVGTLTRRQEGESFVAFLARYLNEG